MECIKYINDLELEIQILNDLKKNRLSDNQDCSEFERQINKKQQIIENCKLNLEKMSENQICYRIYFYMLNGMNPSKAIEKVAEENYIKGIKPTDVPTLWLNYYKKVKKILETK